MLLFRQTRSRVTACGSQNFFGLERRKILTATPFRPRFIRHWRRFSRNAANSATSAYTYINFQFSIKSTYMLLFRQTRSRVTACGSQNFFGLERRKILTATPFRPRFIRHWRRFGRNAANSATSAYTYIKLSVSNCHLTERI